MKTDPEVQRLPIWDDAKVMKYMIHRSKITDFISDRVSTLAAPAPAAPALAAPAPADLTLGDLLADANLKRLFSTSFATVSPDKTLAYAKLVMEITPSCEDVFVTKAGNREDEVIGWLTDNMISKAAEL